MPEHARKRNSRATPTLPRYAEIRRALERAIVSGSWPPGHRIPSEQQLLARYGCSRMTVNKALSELAQSGMIVRRRRSGSFVAAPAGRNVLQIHDIEQDVRLSGKSYRLDLRARTERKASRRDANRLEIAAGTPVLALECLHFVDGHAFVLEDRLINLAAVPAARRADFTTRSPGSWLLEQVPWSQAEHRISAVNASLRTADLLSIAEGFACLVVERRTRHASAPITQVTLFYPGDRYELQARFDPSGTSD